jgi:hypothetical protein
VSEDRHIDVNFDVSEAPTLGRFLGSDAFVRLLMGPWGSGKSAACCTETLRRSIEMPRCKARKRRSRWTIIRNTYRELEDTTIKTFEQWVKPELGRWRNGDNAFELTFDDVEAEVIFRALDRPDHVRKLLSLETTGAYVNEAKEIAKAVWDAIQGRMGRYPPRDEMRTKENPRGLYWYGMWADTNPPDTDHYLYKLFEEGNPVVKLEVPDPETGKMETIERRCELFRQPGGRSKQAENLKHLPPGYYAGLVLGKGPDWIKVNVDAEYGAVMDGKPIYPEYKDSQHCDASVKPQRLWGITLGQDFGLTPACVFVQRDPGDGQLQVFREMVSEDMGAVRFGAELARVLRSDYPGRDVRGFGDPAGEQRAQTDERTPFDIMLAAGVPMVPAPTNDFTRRRESVAGLLLRLTLKGRPALVISPECKVLRKAMQGGYCRRRMRIAGDERFHDVPDKNQWSHVAEGLQYACVGEGEDTRAITGGRRRKVRLHIKTHRAAGG